MDSFLNKLQKTPTNYIPFLFPGTGDDALGESWFEIMIQLEEINLKVIDSFLAFIIQTDQGGLLYSVMIDKNLKKLFDLGIDLKKYFESNLALRPIE